jgi:molybdopterin synthase catalytic subunit
MDQTTIKVQTEDFNFSDHVAQLEHNNHTDGAVVTFVGRVRNQNNGNPVYSLYLEHYPAATEKALQRIVELARSRWCLGRVCVIHRVGVLTLGEQIVFVGVTSKHRQDAFAATEFIIDYLKVQALFWKKESSSQGEQWLSKQQRDIDKANKW